MLKNNFKQYVSDVSITKEKLTANLFISANCLVEDTESNTSYEVSYKNIETVTKLQHGGLLFPFHKMPQNHPNSLKNSRYKDYDYTLHEKNAATFGRRRGTDRIHAARDLYSDVNEAIYGVTRKS